MVIFSTALPLFDEVSANIHQLGITSHFTVNAAAVARKSLFPHLRDVGKVAVISNPPTTICQRDIHRDKTNVVMSVGVKTIIDFDCCFTIKHNMMYLVGSMF